MTEFFEGAVGSGTFAPRRKVTHRSKRLSKAMANLRKHGDDSDDDVQEIAPRPMVSKRKRSRPEVIKIESDEDMGSENDDSAEEESSSDDDNDERLRKGSGKSGKTVKAVKKKTKA